MINNVFTIENIILYLKVLGKMIIINLPFLILALIFILISCAIITRVTKNKYWLRQLKEKLFY